MTLGAGSMMKTDRICSVNYLFLAAFRHSSIALIIQAF